MSKVLVKATDARWLAGAAAALSIVACYGTLALIAVLSLLGIALSVNEHVWAGFIVFFAFLAVMGVWFGFRRHHNLAPTVVAAVGTLLIVWAVYGADAIRESLRVPSQAIELVGFVTLVAAVAWDWSTRRGREV